MKRPADLLFACIGLIAMAPVLITVSVVIWASDLGMPLYISRRVGLDGRLFRMVKLRSMRVGSDKSGVDSTSANDQRITAIGHVVRKYKIDEFGQLLNVIMGSMSFVGPRPNVMREVCLYTDEERRLLSVRPGITDLSSIVFSDLGDILSRCEDPDISYNQLVRPYKSRLGLWYVDNASLFVDVYIIVLTLVSMVSRRSALHGVAELLRHRGAPDDLVQVALRENPLMPTPPPGATDIVMSRSVPSDQC